MLVHGDVRLVLRGAARRPVRDPRSSARTVFLLPPFPCSLLVLGPVRRSEPRTSHGAAAPRAQAPSRSASSLLMSCRRLCSASVYPVDSVLTCSRVSETVLCVTCTLVASVFFLVS